MAITVQTLFTDPEPEPEGGPITPAERDLAGPILKDILDQSPGFEAQLREAMAKERMAKHAEAESEEATKAAKDAVTDTATTRHGVDPGSEHELSPVFAGVIAVMLALVDAVPSYFGAQAFGLDQAATVIITALLMAALGAAMWLLALFSARGRRRARLSVEIVVGIGLVVMMVLRAQFLAATSGGSPASALLQALALTSMSGGLVAVGYIVLEHRKPKVVATAERTGGQRQAVAVEAIATAKRLRAGADDARRGLDNYLVPHALKVDPPEGLDHHRFVAALRAVIRGLVVGQEDATGSV
jgi:hypothetical protein